MQELFILTRDSLLEIAQATGLSYKEVNVLIWYFLVPFSWAVLLDLILGKHLVKAVSAAVGLAALACLYFYNAFDWLFDRSCQWLLDSKVGGSYVNASVIICLLVPIIIYLVLLPWAAVAIFKRRKYSKIETSQS